MPKSKPLVQLQPNKRCHLHYRLPAPEKITRFKKQSTSRPTFIFLLLLVSSGDHKSGVGRLACPLPKTNSDTEPTRAFHQRLVASDLRASPV